MSKADKKKDKR